MKFPGQLLLFTIIFITFWSCENNESNNYQHTIKEFSVDQIDYKIYQRSFGTPTSKDGSQPDTSNGYFLQINLGITNNSNHSIKFDTSMFRLINSNGRVFSFSKEMNDNMKYFDTSLNETLVPANMSKEGFIIFTVPAVDNYILELNGGSWANGLKNYFINVGDKK